MIATIAIAATTTAACGRARQPRAGSEPELLNRVTNAYPAYSPDGRHIAYMSNATGDFDIYVVTPGTGTRLRLTDAPGQDGTPVWSPDGARIAFRSMRTGRSQIFVMDADGSNQRPVAETPYHDEHPFWSPDGEWILFTSRGRDPLNPDNFDIHVMRADGTDVRLIAATPESETYPVWSPDGERIACRRILADGNWEIVVMDRDGANARIVAPHPAVEGWPAWSPDGSRLAFTSERANSEDVYVVELATGTVQRLTFDDTRAERQPWWSPDGRHLVFARYTWFRDEPFYEAADLFTIRVPNSATDRAPSGPEARAHHQFIYHAGDERVYLLGGSTRRGDDYHYFDDIWSWDRDAWTRVASLPFPRSSHGAAYHENRQSIVLFGGGSGRSFAMDGTLHEWRGGEWRTVDQRLRSLSEPGVCHDRARSRTVLFGGWDADNQYSDATVEWTGEAFVEIEAVGPAPRAGHALVWDPVRNRCVLFGGRGSDGFLADTWEWTGSAWRQLPVQGPSARWFFGAATDDANRRVILFGGNGPETEQSVSWAHGDTWSWDGSSWARVSAAGPPARGSARLAFDGRGVVLFGGRTRTTAGLVDLADTWRLEGQTWVRLH